ncbi:hypothetical protein IWZ03DRAFT_355941 [Phyllosticta citriasiana]|uniref:Uncharacterized protein n=1 Tax=Phyllosticta citriasiana TaxID=595635 RepID=A0ABR1KZ01_9PEZI
MVRRAWVLLLLLLSSWMTLVAAATGRSQLLLGPAGRLLRPAEAVLRTYFWRRREICRSIRDRLEIKRQGWVSSAQTNGSFETAGLEEPIRSDRVGYEAVKMEQMTRS